MDEDEIARMAAEGNVPDANTPPAQTPPAVDYAKLYADAQAQMAVQQQQLNQLIQAQQALIQVGQTVPAQQAVPQPDPFEKFDPETAKALRAVTDNLKTTFNQELAQRDSQLSELRNTTVFNQIAQAAGNVPPTIIKQAQELYANLSKKGIPLNHSDALSISIGEAVRNGTYNPASRASSNGPTVLTGGSRSPTPRARPANFDQLPYSKQVEIMEANGDLDSAF